jgi:hypothetical protein
LQTTFDGTRSLEEDAKNSMTDDIFHVFPVQFQKTQFIAIELKFVPIEYFDFSFEPLPGCKLAPVEFFGTWDRCLPRPVRSIIIFGLRLTLNGWMFFWARSISKSAARK